MAHTVTLTPSRIDRERQTITITPAQVVNGSQQQQTPAVPAAEDGAGIENEGDTGS